MHMQPCKNTPGETLSLHIKGGVATVISWFFQRYLYRLLITVQRLFTGHFNSQNAGTVSSEVGLVYI